MKKVISQLASYVMFASSALLFHNYLLAGSWLAAWVNFCWMILSVMLVASAHDGLPAAAWEFTWSWTGWYITHKDDFKFTAALFLGRVTHPSTQNAGYLLMLGPLSITLFLMEVEVCQL